ncbi:hypothetical protein HMPREF1581_00484 [Gardnerella vaginalis JCP8108]|uniref:Uncharacterized protein n=1 Tax=Gardnerella vaginalis JCP8108 TaxID=1261066 RepID=S4GR91_GARVA|nr:hypothetical protein HMPREF1581_00484 [Gardnerella vaginalis JCP8108]
MVKAYFKGDLSTELSTILAVAGDYSMENNLGNSPKYFKGKIVITGIYTKRKKL